ncbi:MAG: cation:proton antiporter [Endomicrobia bacterium]|nr:cation:proton antiporter [Endomicrobiia bacterium]MCL2506236.1 cation:proton antiporter [Endomicrobiia bacterium]
MGTSIVASIFFISLVLILGQVFSATFQKTRIPDALPLMVIGLIVGPVLHLVHLDHFGRLDRVFTELVLIIIMFRSGAALRFSALREAIGQGLWFTVAAIAAVILLTFWISVVFLGLNPVYAILLGNIIADNSLVVVAPLLSKLNISQKMKTILVIEGSVSSIINVVLVLALLSMSQQASFSTSAVFGKMAYSFLIASVIGILAGFFWSVILNKIRQLENANSLSFAFILLVYAVCGLFKSEGAIGVLMFGLTIGNMRVLHKLWGKVFRIEALSFRLEEKSFFLEVEYILKTLFFVYMGISMRFSSVGYIILGLVFMIVKIGSRIPIANYTLSKNIDRTDTSVALAMCPNGLVTAVLAATAAQTLPEPNGIRDSIYSLIFFSFIFCAVLSFLIEKGYFEKASDKLFARHKKREEKPAVDTVIS